MKAKSRQERRRVKHRAYRRKVAGDEERSRLGIFKSNKYTYAYIADDVKGKVVMSKSTKSLAAGKKGLSSVEAAAALGKELGAAAVAAGIKKIVFDRSGYPYHGRVKAVADGARAAGLDF